VRGRDRPRARRSFAVALVICTLGVSVANAASASPPAWDKDVDGYFTLAAKAGIKFAECPLPTAAKPVRAGNSVRRRIGESDLVRASVADLLPLGS
jgi:hypothetical protein